MIVAAATLPISIKVAGEKLGVPENIYGFTLPLGNTCGMNGFAMFIGLCCIFASNLYGMPVTSNTRKSTQDENTGRTAGRCQP